MSGVVIAGGVIPPEARHSATRPRPGPSLGWPINGGSWTTFRDRPLDLVDDVERTSAARADGDAPADRHRARGTSPASSSSRPTGSSTACSSTSIPGHPRPRARRAASPVAERVRDVYRLLDRELGTLVERTDDDDTVVAHVRPRPPAVHPRAEHEPGARASRLPPPRPRLGPRRPARVGPAALDRPGRLRQARPARQGRRPDRADRLGADARLHERRLDRRGRLARPARARARRAASPPRGLRARPRRAGRSRSRVHRPRDRRSTRSGAVRRRRRCSPGRTSTARPTCCSRPRRSTPSPTPGRWSRRRTGSRGDHRPEGVYVAAGPGTGPADGSEISLTDFAGMIAAAASARAGRGGRRPGRGRPPASSPPTRSARSRSACAASATSSDARRAARDTMHVSDERIAPRGTAANVVGLARRRRRRLRRAAAARARRSPAGGLALVTVAVQVAFVASAGARFGMDLAAVRLGRDRRGQRRPGDACAASSTAAPAIALAAGDRRWPAVIAAASPLDRRPRRARSPSAPPALPLIAVANVYLGATRGLKQMGPTLCRVLDRPAGRCGSRSRRSAIAAGGETDAAVAAYGASWLAARDRRARALAAAAARDGRPAGDARGGAGRAALRRCRGRRRRSWPRRSSGATCSCSPTTPRRRRSTRTPPPAGSRSCPALPDVGQPVFSPFAADLHARGERARLDALFKRATRWALAGDAARWRSSSSWPRREVLRAFGPGLRGRARRRFASCSLGQTVNVATGGVAFVLVMAGFTGLDLVDNLLAAVAAVRARRAAGLGGWARPARPPPRPPRSRP